MTARRIGAICILVFLLCGCIGAVLPVNAAENWTAALKIEGIDENTEEGTITVRVSVEQITCQSGIFSALFNIHYDNSVLELISWENSRPTGWDFSGSDPDAIDFTRIKQKNGKNYLDFQMGNAASTNGVKRNGELYTDLHFKVLSDTAESATITVTDIRLADITLVNRCQLSNQKCEIGLHGNRDSSVEPVESEDPEESSENVGSIPSESSEESADSSVSAPETTSGETNSDDASDVGDASDASDTSLSSSEGAPLASDNSAEKTSKKVRMWITVEDITDPAGVSSLAFTLKYNGDFLQYVRHECLLPDDWDLRTEYTEDLTQLSKGSIRVWIVNHDAGHGAKENGKLGILVEFTFSGTDFDPDLLTIESMQLINDEIKEMPIDSYRLATRYEFNGEMIYDDTFSSDESEGSTLKIWIAVIAVVAVLGAAVVTFLVIRKKKLA